MAPITTTELPGAGAWPLPAEACPALEPEAEREPGAGELVPLAGGAPVDGAAAVGVVTVGTAGATGTGAVEDTAGTLGAGAGGGAGFGAGGGVGAGGTVTVGGGVTVGTVTVGVDGGGAGTDTVGVVTVGVGGTGTGAVTVGTAVVTVTVGSGGTCAFPTWTSTCAATNPLSATSTPISLPSRSISRRASRSGRLQLERGQRHFGCGVSPGGDEGMSGSHLRAPKLANRAFHGGASAMTHRG